MSEQIYRRYIRRNGFAARERERERERERQTDRQTDRDRDRETATEMGRRRVGIFRRPITVIKW